MLHRGARAAVEFAGGPGFADGNSQPLARLGFTVNGTPVPLARNGLAWERAMEWLPTFTCSADSLVIRGTVFAPYGRDADTAGVVYAVAIENRGRVDIELAVTLDGTLGYRQLRVRSSRPFEDAHVAMLAPDLVTIDTALTDEVDEDGARHAVVAALSARATQLGARTIAEHVTTISQLEELTGLGVGLVEGPIPEQLSRGAQILPGTLSLAPSRADVL